MVDKYFEWLCSLATGKEGNGESSYSLLLRILHDLYFLPILKLDYRQALNGKRLRFTFASTLHEDIAEINALTDYLDETLGMCTMLELLISLSEDMTYSLLDSDYETTTDRIFFELLCNLGLDLYKDEVIIEDENAYYDIEKIADSVIERRFGYDGKGGIFPLENPKRDQRETLLQGEMNDYLEENYDLL